jgi:hypothetical protein
MAAPGRPTFDRDVGQDGQRGSLARGAGGFSVTLVTRGADGDEVAADARGAWSSECEPAIPAMVATATTPVKPATAHPATGRGAGPLPGERPRPERLDRRRPDLRVRKRSPTSL